MTLSKFVLPEVVVGCGALRLVGRYARNFGIRKVLLVTDPGLVEAGWAGKAAEHLREAGIGYTQFDGVTPNPKDHEVAKGVEAYRAHDCDAIVTVGGGSPIDCAKGIGIVVANGGHPRDYEGVDAVRAPLPPLICVPTTAGSSADVSQFAILSDTAHNSKLAIVSKAIVPDVALVDADTTVTMSADLTGATGIDALSHAFEAYVSTASSPLTDLNALQAVRLVVDNLPGALEAPQNMSYREPMMMGSLMAGIAFSNAGLGLLHAMAHAVGGRMDARHGDCNAVLLRHVVEFNFEAAPEKYRRLGEAMGLALAGCSLEEVKDRLLERLAAFLSRTGCMRTLDDLGMTSDLVRDLASTAIDDPCLATNPRRAGLEEIEHIYGKALRR